VQKYELIFILKAEAGEGEMKKRVERVKEILSEHGGEITQDNHWGVRRLAYEINHENRGDYMFLRFKSEGTANNELDRFLRLDDQVLRHLIVVDDEWDERNRASMAKRRKDNTEESAGAPE
jgi:small subunit ribosomal protein S6